MNESGYMRKGVKRAGRACARTRERECALRKGDGGSGDKAEKRRLNASTNTK